MKTHKRFRTRFGIVVQNNINISADKLHSFQWDTGSCASLIAGHHWVLVWLKRLNVSSGQGL